MKLRASRRALRCLLFMAAVVATFGASTAPTAHADEVAPYRNPTYLAAFQELLTAKWPNQFSAAEREPCYYRVQSIRQMNDRIDFDRFDNWTTQTYEADTDFRPYNQTFNADAARDELDCRRIKTLARGSITSWTRRIRISALPRC